MDFKIQFGLICVTVLLAICHRTDAAATSSLKPSITTAPGGAAAPVTTAAPAVTTAAPGGAAAPVTTAAPGASAAPGATAAPVSGTAAPTTTPASIDCFNANCPSNCTSFTTTATCKSDTTKGCKTEIGAKDDYTFSCSAVACVANTTTTTTTKCCFETSCNTYAAAQSKSKATTMFGNLVPIALAVMLAFHV